MNDITHQIRKTRRNTIIIRIATAVANIGTGIIIGWMIFG